MKARILLCFVLTPLFKYGQSAQISQTGKESVARQPISAEYMHKAVFFSKQVKSSELTNSEFILADNSVFLTSNNCLQYALADKQYYSLAEIKLSESRTAFWRYQWENSYFSIIRFVKQGIINTIFKTNSKNWEYFYKHVGRDFNEFLLPLFISK